MTRCITIFVAVDGARIAASLFPPQPGATARTMIIGDKSGALLRALGLSSALALLALHATGTHVGAQCNPNPIVCENAQTGAPSTEWDVGLSDSTLQGFATDISVNKGDTVHFKISTTAAQFRIDIYRLGYYNSLGARKIASIANVTGMNQLACLIDSATRLVDCGNWSESAVWSVPTSAVSGVYVAKLSRPDTGGASHIVFVVRDDASTSDLLFQTSDTTWHAYNQYGGYTLAQAQPPPAYKMSHNRPVLARREGNE